jgi:hypothetical protein
VAVCIFWCCVCVNIYIYIYIYIYTRIHRHMNIYMHIHERDFNVDHTSIIWRLTKYEDYETYLIVHVSESSLFACKDRKSSLLKHRHHA